MIQPVTPPTFMDRMRALLRPRAVLLEFLVVLTLFAFTVGERAYLAVQREVMEAGDPFNFLFIAQAYSQGRIPQGEKRLPLYPLTILVGWKGLGLDPMFTATAISVLAGGGTTVLLYLLGRRMKIRPLPLALVLLLSVLAPVSNSVGIRPLADSLFLFLVVACTYAATVAGSSVRSALLTGGLFGLLMLTRFESMVLAPVLVLLLRLRMPWRRVLLAALPVIILYAAWIPYSLYVHGTVTGGYFEEWGPKEGAVGGRLADVPAKLQRIASGLGWLRLWEHADWAVAQLDTPPLPRILGSGAWWVSLLALLGVPWLLFTARRAALPFLAVFFVFSTLYSMWVVYGRFVAPGIPAFYLSAAAGASALSIIATRLFRTLVLRWAAAAGVTVFLLWLVRDEAPGLMTVTTQRVFDNEGSGYSMVLAIRELARREGRVAIYHELMPLVYLGIIGDPLAPPERAYLIGDPPKDAPQNVLENLASEHIARMRSEDVRYLVERGEPLVARVLHILTQHDVITGTEEIRFPLGHPPGPDFDTTRIHTLAWDR